MTYNEKKRFFGSYQYSIRKIKRLQQEYEEWETIGTNITQKLSDTGVRSSDNQSKVERCAIHLENIQQSILDEISMAEHNREKILSAINNVRDLRHRELLEMVYIRGIPVRKIAFQRNKPEQNIYKQVRTAINKIEI